MRQQEFAESGRVIVKKRDTSIELESVQQLQKMLEESKSDLLAFKKLGSKRRSTTKLPKAKKTKRLVKPDHFFTLIATEQPRTLEE